jgi:type I restriction enzyme R subunit
VAARTARQAFEQIVEAAAADEQLRIAATVNPAGKFELLVRGLLERLFTDRMDQNEEIFVRYMNDRAFRDAVASWMSEETYRRLRGSTAS